MSAKLVYTISMVYDVEASLTDFNSDGKEMKTHVHLNIVAHTETYLVEPVTSAVINHTKDSKQYDVQVT